MSDSSSTQSDSDDFDSSSKHDSEDDETSFLGRVKSRMEDSFGCSVLEKLTHQEPESDESELWKIKVEYPPGVHKKLTLRSVPGDVHSFIQQMTSHVPKADGHPDETLGRPIPSKQLVEIRYLNEDLQERTLSGKGTTDDLRNMLACAHRTSRGNLRIDIRIVLPDSVPFANCVLLVDFYTIHAPNLVSKAAQILSRKLPNGVFDLFARISRKYSAIIDPDPRTKEYNPGKLFGGIRAKYAPVGVALTKESYGGATAATWLRREAVLAEKRAKMYEEEYAYSAGTSQSMTEMKWKMSLRERNDGGVSEAHEYMVTNKKAETDVKRRFGRSLLEMAQQKIRAAAYTGGHDGSAAMNLRKTFRRYDTSGNGELEREEFNHAIRHLVPMTDHELDVLWRTFDVNKDGSISFNEFVDVVERGHNAHLHLHLKRSHEDSKDTVYDPEGFAHKQFRFEGVRNNSTDLGGEWGMYNHYDDKEALKKLRKTSFGHLSLRERLHLFRKHEEALFILQNDIMEELQSSGTVFFPAHVFEKEMSYNTFKNGVIQMKLKVPPTEEQMKMLYDLSEGRTDEDIQFVSPRLHEQMIESQLKKGSEKKKKKQKKPDFKVIEKASLKELEELNNNITTANASKTFAASLRRDSISGDLYHDSVHGSTDTRLTKKDAVISAYGLLDRVRRKLRKQTFSGGLKGHSFRREFEHFDLDKDGKISRIEFYHGIQRICALSDHEFNVLWRSLDKNHDGTIRYNEFLDLLYKYDDSGKEEELRRFRQERRKRLSKMKRGGRGYGSKKRPPMGIKGRKPLGEGRRRRLSSEKGVNKKKVKKLTSEEEINLRMPQKVSFGLCTGEHRLDGYWKSQGLYNVAHAEADKK
eukprot:g3919.t1